MKPFPLKRIEIRLEIGESRALHLMLSDSGAINRMGDGSGDKAPLAMGRTEPALFAEIAATIPPEWWEMAGRYILPDQKGSPCQLEIALGGEDQETGIGFSFGSQSDGPPADIMNWVDAVLAATEPWYESQTQQKKQRGKKNR